MSSFDTHAAVKTLTAAGAAEDLAVAVVDVARTAAGEHDRELATRADLDNLREATRADIASVRGDVEHHREATRADLAELRTELAALELRLIKWIVGTGIAVAAAVAGILRLLS